MRISELKKIRNFKITDIEQFKKVVIEAVESDCHWKKYDQWLYEEYEDCSDKSNQYIAKIIVINECYNKSNKTFRVNNENISSVTIYDIFYTNMASGGFVIHDITLYYDAVNSFGVFFK